MKDWSVFYIIRDNSVYFNWTIGDGQLYCDNSGITLFRQLVSSGDFICPEVMTRWSL